MKKLVILIMTVVGLVAQGQNILSLTGGNGYPGDEVTVTLSLTNSDAVTALQTFVPLGSNLTYVAGSATLTDRSNGHQLSASVLRDTLRLYSYSLSLNSYNGTSGALLTFRLRLGREPGQISLMPTQTLLSSETGSSLLVGTNGGMVTVLAPKVQVTPVNIDYGHVPIRSSYTQNLTLKNIGTEVLTLTGVTFSDGALFCQVPTTLDVGAQQTVTITYSPVTAGATTMSAVFHSNAEVGDSVLTIAADPFTVNELRPLDVSGYTDSVVTVELRMNNMDSIVGLQTCIKLPEALTYVAGSFRADTVRAPGYTATAGLQGDTLTLLLASLTGTPIYGTDGVVANFQLRLHGYGYHTLQLLNTSLSNEAGRNVVSAVYSGQVEIYSPYLRIVGSLDLGNTPVTEAATAELPLQNYGNAPLEIDRVIFMHRGWTLADALPLTVDNYGSVTLHVVYNGTVEGVHSGEMLLYTNDPRNDLKRISLTAHRYEPNSLYMEGNAIAQAATPEVDIVLDNYSAITALQLDVQYPHRDFTLEPSDITLSSRNNGHIVSTARQNDSMLRVLILSMQNQPFSGNSGSVARLRLHAHDSLSSEQYPIKLLNVTSACTDGQDRLTDIQNVGWFATRIQHDTTIVEVHDTTYVYVHDTTYINVHDTTYIPYAVHDTTYIDVHDTTYIDVPYAVHDTTIVVDTLTVTQFDTITNTVYDTIDNYIYDTLTLTDTLWLTHFDTIWLHDTVIIHDTVYITHEAINGVEALNAKVYSSQGQIVVDGADGNRVTLYDVNGRVLATKQDDYTPLYFDTPVSGTYMIKIGAYPARKVVVIR